LITDNSDIRTAYYADATHYKLVRPDKVNYAAGASAEVTSKGKDKISLDLTESGFGAPVALGEETELSLKLPKRYPFSNGVVILELAEDYTGFIELFYLDRSSKDWELLGTYENDATLRFLNKKGPVNADCFKLVFKPSAGNPCQLKRIRLLLDTRWRILARGRGAVNVGRWFPAAPPEGIEGFGHSVKQLGGDSVFVLVMQKDSDFRAFFAKKEVDFPLDLVGEFKDRRKGPFTLYQGRAE
jgi:hypothetical protein